LFERENKEDTGEDEYKRRNPVEDVTTVPLREKVLGGCKRKTH